MAPNAKRASHRPRNHRLVDSSDSLFIYIRSNNPDSVDYGFLKPPWFADYLPQDGAGRCPSNSQVFAFWNNLLAYWAKQPDNNHISLQLARQVEDGTLIILSWHKHLISLRDLIFFFRSCSIKAKPISTKIAAVLSTQHLGTFWKVGFAYPQWGGGDLLLCYILYLDTDVLCPQASRGFQQPSEALKCYLQFMPKTGRNA